MVDDVRNQVSTSKALDRFALYPFPVSIQYAFRTLLLDSRMIDCLRNQRVRNNPKLLPDVCAMYILLSLEAAYCICIAYGTGLAIV